MLYFFFHILPTCIPYLSSLSMTLNISATTRSLHVCFGAPNPDIQLQCEEGEMIVVEEATVGWTNHKPGTSHCPRDREECTAPFDLVVQTCQGLQQCTVPNSEIYTDLHKPQQCAGPTNYFDGSYICLSGKNVKCQLTHYRFYHLEVNRYYTNCSICNLEHIVFSDNNIAIVFYICYPILCRGQITRLWWS